MPTTLTRQTPNQNRDPPLPVSNISVMQPSPDLPLYLFPGMGADDRSTRPMRRFLTELGYDVHGWGLGPNVPSPELVDRLRARARALIGDAGPGASISLVGWSLGGIYAREIAKATPDRVRQVITLGSPFRSTPDEESNVDVLLRRLAPARQAERKARRRLGDERPLPVPSTANP